MKSDQMHAIGFVTAVLFLRAIVQCQTEGSSNDLWRGLLLVVLVSI